MRILISKVCYTADVVLHHRRAAYQHAKRLLPPLNGLNAEGPHKNDDGYRGTSLGAERNPSLFVALLSTLTTDTSRYVRYTTHNFFLSK